MAERVLVMLINLSWQLTLIFVLACLILAIFKIRSASARRVIWLAVVLCPLVLVPMNIVSSDIVLLRAGDFQRGATIDHPFDLTGSSFDQGEKSSSAIAPMEKEPLDKPISFQSETEVLSNHRLSGVIRVKLTLLLTLVWTFSVGAGFTLISAGYLRLKKLISKAHEVKDEKVFRIFIQAREEVGISRRVRLFASNEARTPFSIGFIHPCVVLPDRMLGSGKKLRMVLIHEIVHLKRLDDVVNLLCRVIGSFMFFHPLFHLAVRELKLSNEETCDGWTIRLTGTREDYANCLVELSRACVGRLPIGFGESGSSMARRVKSIFRGEEVFKMMSKKSVVFLSASVFFLVLMISAVRLVDFASAGQPAHISRIDRFQQCENRAGAGFFWVDTTNGETWWADPGNVRWAYGGKPEGVETAVIGTYMPCPNNAGGGLFIVNTATGEAWWTMGYKPEWKALGKPETADAGKIGTYMPCENMGGAGLYVLNTTTGSGWWTPPTDKQGWEVLDNPEAKAGEIGTYIPYRNKSSAGLFILNTATGECWWTNGKDWKRLDKGGAVGGEIGTYMPYDNKDGAGILILSTKTGEGWWTNGGDWEFFGRPSGTSLAGADKPQAKSVLLQNDPNPFNSETWIPYQLKDAASVSIRIYDFTGQLVRALDLGRKDAGVYISRSEAAYWDGEDEDGKEAASGVYFYRISLKREGRKDIVEIGKMAKLTGTPPPGVDKLQQLILKISDPGPDMTYGTMVLNDQVVSVETLLDSLQRAAPKQKQMLIIQSGRNVPHDQMVKVMDLAKRAGIEKIGFSMVAK